MFSIVQSIWISEQRGREIHSCSRSGWDEDLVQTVGDQAARNSEVHAMYSEIIAAVQRLPEEQRVVLLLVAVEGFSYSETAELRGMPLGAVTSHVSKALQKIGNMFGASDGRNGIQENFQKCICGCRSPGQLSEAVSRNGAATRPKTARCICQY